MLSLILNELLLLLQDLEFLFVRRFVRYVKFRFVKLEKIVSAELVLVQPKRVRDIKLAHELASRAPA